MNEIFLGELNIDNLKSVKFLYHGSACIDDECNFNIIENIDITKSNIYCDFGPGFYLTLDESQAQARAQSKKELLNKQYSSEKMRNVISKNRSMGKYIKEIPVKVAEAIVIKYPFQFIEEKIGEYRIFKNVDKEWSDFIYNNRNRQEPTSETDEHNKDGKYSLVFGYMADGAMSKLLKLFCKKFGELKAEEIQLIRETFLRRKKRTGNQVSLHQQSSIEICLEDGHFV